MKPTTLLGLIAGCLMLQPLSTDLYLPSLPHLVSEFAVTAAAVQQTLSLFVFGFGLAQLISGPLSDRFGRRPLMLAGLAIYVIASLACATAPTLNWLIAARFIQAIGCCTAIVVVRALIRDVYSPAEGAKTVARASSLLAIAPLFGPILGGYLQVGFGWRAAFIFHTLFGTVILIAAWRLFAETHHQRNPAALHLRVLLSRYRRIAISAGFWSFALPAALSYAAIFSYISGSAFVLIEVLAVPTSLYGYCFAIGVIGYLLGTLICRPLLNRYGLAHTLLIGTTITLISGLIFLAAVLGGISHWALVVLGMFLTFGAHGITFPCAQPGAIAPFPGEAGAAAGLLGATSMLAAFISGNWIGASFDGTIQPLALISATIGILLIISTWLLRRQRAIIADSA